MREFELIDAIRRSNPSLGRTVVVPPGDDLGMIRLFEGADLLAGVDQVVAGVHLAADASPEAYGRKVMNRSLSDVAAMACVPIGALVSAVLPNDLMSDSQWSIAFADAARDAALAFDVPLFGGDVATFPAGAGVFTAAATILAVPDDSVDGRVVLRSGASPGDRLYVSGSYGCSLDPDGGGHHLEFVPRVELARRLHAELGDALTSMIDVSDGLASEIGHLAQESEVSISLDAGAVPRRHGADTVRALADGEDYELCFTVGPGGVLPSELDGIPLTHVGGVDVGRGVAIHEDGRPVVLDRTGWEHAE